LIYNLQVLRAIAAIGVVIYHIDYHFVSDVHTDFLGVATFFVLSGFIMCYVTKDDAEGFLTHRIVRIVPLYWLCILARFAILYGPHLLDPAAWTGQVPLILRSMFFVPSDEPPFVAVGWTLNFEMYFYALFTAALLISRRFAPVIVAAVILAVFAVDKALPGTFLLHFYAHSYIGHIISGIALFYLWRITPDRLPKLPTAIAATAMLIFSYAILVKTPSPGQWTYVLPAIIVGSMLLMARGGVDISWRPLVVLGDASYAIYLTHTLVMGVIRRIAPQVLDLGKSEIIWCLALLALCIVLGLAVHLAIEKPMLRFIRSQIAAHKRGRVAIQASA
jgi:exopolysaccharide production protein ExoZ